jgi:hypothetical protein
MNRQKTKGKTFHNNGLSIFDYETRLIISTKIEIANSVQAYNDRKLSKEETLNNLQIILNKINAKIGSSSLTTN